MVSPEKFHQEQAPKTPERASIELSTEEQYIWENLASLYQTERASIVMEDFVGKLEYTATEVAEDKRALERRRSMHEEEEGRKPGGSATKTAGEIFEAAAFFELKSALSGLTSVEPSSEYDDRINGIDTVIGGLPRAAEAGGKDKSGEGFAIAVDFTSHEKEAVKKIDRILEGITKNRPAEVKYLEVEAPTGGKLKGRVRRLPSVVIGLEYRNVVNEAGKLARGRKNKSEVMRAFSEAQWQYTMLYQILAQLKAFAGYAEQMGRKNIQDMYLLAHQELLAKMKKRPNTDPAKLREKIKKDAVNRTITETLKEITSIGGEKKAGGK